MFDYVELDKSTLTHLDYHWFWGLRYSEVPQVGHLGKQVDSLLNNEVKLTELMERQKRLYDRSNVVLRYFYWLFNINNYTYQSYVLTAYRGHQNYLAHHMKKEGHMPTTNQSAWDAFDTVMGFVRNKIKSVLSAATKKFMAKEDDIVESSTALVRLYEPPVAIRSVEAPLVHQEVEAVIVNAAMLPHLGVLGIALQRGDTLQLSDFKARCKERFRASHPDKEGGSKEAFCRVREAAEALRDIMSSRVKPGAMPKYEESPEEYWAEFNARMAEFWADLAAEKAIRAEIQVIWAEIQTAVDAGREAHEKEVAAHEKEVEAHEKEMAAHEKELEAHEKEMAAHEKEVEAQEKEMAAHTAWKIKMTAALKLLQERLLEQQNALSPEEELSPESELSPEPSFRLR